MSLVYGIRWDDGRRIRLVASLIAAIATLAVLAGMSASAGRAMTSVVVTARPGAVSSAAHSVESLGGKVGAPISLIHGFLAKVPSSRVSTLRGADGVLSAVADSPVTLSSSGSGKSSPGASLAMVRQEIGATDLANQGITGKGVDIAMIDSGLVPVAGLNGADKVYVGPDVTPEGDDSDTRGLDTYGHGTHIGGIIAGDNPPDGFQGVAPGARLVSVKAATANGDTSLGEILLAISWVVANRHDDGLNIRVLNLSFGAQLIGSYVADPLSYAVEQAWNKGIVVVAAAGNGNSGLGLDTPAADPFVVAVGATSIGSSPGMADDSVPDWSRAGSGRLPDFVAPGTSIVSLRDPGSWVDQNHPEGRVGTGYFKGSGTSQAAAVVSGAVGLLLQDEPALTPDQVKALLVDSAVQVPGADARQQGAGQLDVADAANLPVPDADQSFRPASLSAIFGADHSRHMRVDPGGTGKDLAANRWSANRWSANRWSANRWSSNRWSDTEWSSNRWSDSSWG